MKSKPGWDTLLFDPITLPDDTVSRTLRDAGTHVASLSKAEQKKQHWMTAAEILMMSAEAGDRYLAWAAMNVALNAGRPLRRYGSWSRFCFASRAPK